MKKISFVFAWTLAFTFAPATAGADALDRIPEGAPIYAAIRPVALIGALRRLGVNELPEVQKLRQQLGGIDPLDPALLAPTGLDVASPVAAALFEAQPGGKRYHHRIVATIRDKMLFTAFLGGIAMSSQIPMTAVAPGTPLAKLGVLATATLPDGGNAIMRMLGPCAPRRVGCDAEAMIIDSIGTWDSSKPPAPAEIARKIPLDVKTAFDPAHGARRLFAPDAALVAYTDGRRLQPMLDAIGAGKGGKAHGPGGSCKAEWAKVPTTFDDLGLALAVDPDAIKLSVAWGTLGGTPLGGLRFHPVDDGALDVTLLSRTAPALLVSYAASLTPFQALKRGGVMESASTLTSSAMRCSAQAWGNLLVRSWPNALGSLIAGVASGKGGVVDPMASSALSLFGQLRNMVLVLRDANAKTVRWAVSGTFDAAAQQVLQVLLATTGQPGTPTPFGKRTPVVYHITVDASTTGTGAMETLPAGPLAFTFTDSDDSLAWAYRTATSMPGASPRPSSAPLPLMALYLDSVQLARLVPLLKLGADAQSVLDVMARMRRVDADLATDGDLFRLTIRAPVKQ